MMVTSSELVRLLAARHGKDFFVAEATLGPAGSQRIDAWAMKKTWSPRTTIGYEVKVSRGDFKRDDKWYTYLNYCHFFYFVAPKGLIDPSELPDEVGLIESSKNAKKLLTKRKATYREPPVDSLNVLMTRALMGNDFHNAESSTAYWEKWLADKKAKGDLGFRVASRLRKEHARIQSENYRLNRTNERLQIVYDTLEEFGLTEEGERTGLPWGVNERLRDAVPSRSTPIASKSCCSDKKTVVSPGSQSLEISNNSTASPGAAPSMSSAADSPARTSASPEAAQVSQASAPVSGWKWPGSFAKYSPASSLWKTRQLSLLGGSALYSGTWPQWGMMCDGECSGLAPLVDHKCGSDCSLFPTPTVQQARRGLGLGSGEISGRDRYGAEATKNVQKDISENGWRLEATAHEWLMLFPIGWTDLKPSGMHKFRQWLHSHGRL